MIQLVTTFDALVEVLRPHVEGVTLRQLIEGDAPDSARIHVCCLVERMRKDRISGPVDLPTLDFVLSEAEDVWGVNPEDLRAWCKERFGTDFLTVHHLVSLAVALFPLNRGIWRGKNEVSRRCPDLVFDDDGLLLMDQPQRPHFTTEGALIGGYFLPYSPLTRQYNLKLTGGFLEALVRIATESVHPPALFGMAIDANFVFDQKYHRPITTRAYMYGPIGISLETLQDPAFPKEPSGTVTVHIQGEVDEFQELDGRDTERLEVMWSYRDGIKTVQIEELVPLDSSDYRTDLFVMNRYVHAQWDPGTQRFIHFDGAVRVYDKSRYSGRLAVDLRKQRQPEAAADRYEKLFRLDMPLQVGEWAKLTASFYYGHELALEYLGGKHYD